MMTCREAARLASESLDHPVDGRRKMSLWVHLAMCGMCRSFSRSLASLHELLRLRREQELTENPAMPPEVHDRIAKRLRED